MLPKIKQAFLEVEVWDNQHLFEALTKLSEQEQVKKGKVLWPARIALTGLEANPGGASEIAEILGKEETLKRLDFSIENLNR